MESFVAAIPLKIKFAMGTEAHKFQVVAVGFAVDQNQVWFDVTISMIGPLTDKRVIEFVRRQGLVGDEKIDNFHQDGVERSAVSSRFFPFIVTVKAVGCPYDPHSDAQ